MFVAARPKERREKDTIGEPKDSLNQTAVMISSHSPWLSAPKRKEGVDQAFMPSAAPKNLRSPGSELISLATKLKSQLMWTTRIASGGIPAPAILLWLNRYPMGDTDSRSPVRSNGCEAGRYGWYRGGLRPEPLQQWMASVSPSSHVELLLSEKPLPPEGCESPGIEKPGMQRLEPHQGAPGLAFSS